MPDLREVFEMTTKQMGEPDVDSWREQERRQRNASRNKKLGVFAVAAAIAVLAVAVIVGSLVGPRHDHTCQPADDRGTVRRDRGGRRHGFLQCVQLLQRGSGGLHAGRRRRHLGIRCRTEPESSDC